MFPMDPSAYSGIAFANPDIATALATGTLVDVTRDLVVVGLLIGIGQIGAILYGIWTMNRSGQRREEDHNKRLKAILDTNQKHHDAAMKALATERDADERRHREAMEVNQKRHEEAMEGLRLSSDALQALILRTSPGRRPPRVVSRNKIHRAAA